MNPTSEIVKVRRKRRKAVKSVECVEQRDRDRSVMEWHFEDKGLAFLSGV